LIIAFYPEFHHLSPALQPVWLKSTISA